jgi:hypothetical protein
MGDIVSAKQLLLLSWHLLYQTEKNAPTVRGDGMPAHVAGR